MLPPFQPRREDRAYLRRLAWTLAVLAVLAALWRASNLLLLAFGSIIGAILFISSAEVFEHAGIRNRKVALVLGILQIAAGLGVIVWIGARQFGQQVAGMLHDLPGTINRIEAGLNTTPVGSAIVQAAQVMAGPGAIGSHLGKLALTSGQFLLNLLIVVVGAVFLAANPGPYLRGTLLLAPPKARPTVERALSEVSTALRLWLKLKLWAMLAMTILFCAGLWLAGVSSWAALGLLGGISEFVPYVGPTVAMVPAIGLAALEGGGVLQRTLVALLIVRLIEAYVLTSSLGRNVIAIPPAVTLFAILGVGAVFGIYAVFFSGAMLVVVYVLVRELYVRDVLGEDISGVPDEVRD